MLQSVRRPAPTTNPYVVQLVDALPDDIDVSWFSWRHALLGPVDVLHVHWPDVLLRRRRRSARLLARARFALLLLRLHVRRTPVVRTVHNVDTHEPLGRVDRLLLAALDRRTRTWVVLNGHTPPRPGRTVLVPHGHYRARYGRQAAQEPVEGRLLYFGLVRPYKGVDGLLEAFSRVTAPGASLHVVGAPADAQVREAVARAARADPRVVTVLEHVGDDRLAAEVAQARLVVLPYREMHNSGALLLALSLDRPVLVPRNPVTLALSAEVGAGWVHTYEGALTADVLTQALEDARGARTASPDLSARDWPALGSAHAQVYRDALTRSGPG